MIWSSLKLLSTQAQQAPVQGSVFAQLTQRIEKSTKQGKPYLELSFADCSMSIVLKIWDNMPCYEECCQLPEESCLALSATWQQSAYGMETRDFQFRPLSPEEMENLFTGDESLLQKQQDDWSYLSAALASIVDPRLHALCALVVQEHEARYRRCAAARQFHHARRGGLVEHVAGMMRAADGLCIAYPELNRDLLLSGIFFHDCGKMWENNFPEASLSMPYTELGELLGHIPMGMEFINSLWARLMRSEEAATWSELSPSNNAVRVHLLHLIASHHGEMAFGSPVLPKTPEAFALHYLDNIDAKLEMLRGCYETSPELAPQIFARKAPLQANAVKALARVEAFDLSQDEQASSLF